MEGALGEGGEVAAQPLEHEVLKIEHVFADLAGWSAQRPQYLGVTVEKIGIVAEVGQNLAQTNFARAGGLGTAAPNWSWLVVRMIDHV